MFPNDFLLENYQRHHYHGDPRQSRISPGIPYHGNLHQIEEKLQPDPFDEEYYDELSDYKNSSINQVREPYAFLSKNDGMINNLA